jgi:hypothetical protein
VDVESEWTLICTDCDWQDELVTDGHPRSGPPSEVERRVREHKGTVDWSHVVRVEGRQADRSEEINPTLVTDGGNDRRCPNCERLLIYNGECAGCDWTADEDDVATDGGHDRDRYIQDPASRLREAIKQIGIVREAISDVHGHPHEDDPALAEAEINLRGVADILEEADIERQHDADAQMADEDDLISDGGTEYFSGPESKTSRSLRIAIGARYGRDLRERVDSIGNSAAAVAFRRPLLEEIATDVLDDVNVEDPSVTQLRAMVARALDREPPAGHFTWLHLRDIYETVVDHDDPPAPEQLEGDQEPEQSEQLSRTIAGPGDGGCHDNNWRRGQ